MARSQSQPHASLTLPEGRFRNIGILAGADRSTISTVLAQEPVMADKPILIPGPDHPITIVPATHRIVVTLGDRTIADTSRALTLQEASYSPVHYIPRADVDMAALVRTDHGSHCPYKGDASYYSIPEGGDRSVNAVWTYEAPHPAVAEIRDHLAFYPDRVDAIREDALETA
jgi:uncharacterized protein (DUF427 family)